MDVIFKNLATPEAINEALKQANRSGFHARHISDFEPNDLVIGIIPSGFKSLDEKFFFKKNRGEFIVIGARPSHGKSAMLFQLAYNVARYGRVVGFSLEMDHDSVVTRQVARDRSISISGIQEGKFKKETLKAKDDLKKLGMYIDDRPGLTIGEICASARAEHNRSKVTAFFVDYLQIITPNEKAGNRAAEVAAISSELKSLGRELRVPIVVAAQLNRNSEYREDKTPVSADLKDSGAIEQDADVVVLLYRDPKAGAEAKVIISKNRNGATGEITMGYDPTQAKFYEYGVSEQDVLPKYEDDEV